MWYVVEIILAQKSDSGSDTVQCESCNVMFEASSASIAYEKAEKWAAKQEKEGRPFKYAGIRNLWSLDCDSPGEGTEVGGSLFEEKYFWHRIKDFIPDKNEIPIIKFEANEDTPIGELMSDEQKERLKKIFGEEN